MIPQTCTVTSEHIRFYLLVFSVFTLFSCRFRAVQIKLTHVGFRAHVKLASRIVSYPMAQMMAPRLPRLDSVAFSSPYCLCYESASLV